MRESGFSTGCSYRNVERICAWADYNKELAIKRIYYWPYKWPRNAMVKLKSGLFHFYVDIKNHHEMEIFSDDGKIFDVNYPRYDILANKSGKYDYFIEMEYNQIAMLIYAYSEQEFRRFEQAFEEWRKRNGK